jgi:hypothetical protein
MQTTGLAGIEPTAYRLGGDRSILLSYSPKRVGSWEIGVGRSELGDRSWEIGVGRSELGDRSWEIGVGRSEIRLLLPPLYKGMAGLG